MDRGRTSGAGNVKKASARRSKADSEGKLSIGALSRITGIPVETLRTWESRYGFPVPERKSSGHRVYLLSTVARIRLIAEALARGHRAGEVVPASASELTALIEATSGGPYAPSARDPVAPPATGAVSEALEAVAAYDSAALTRLLTRDWASLGPETFLTDRVAPLVDAVGEAWSAGKLDIRHEHFFSEKLTDVLRILRLPFENAAKGPLVILATLPGEQHGLGLQMCSLMLAVGGCRVLNLGVEIPPAEIADLVSETGARAVGLSVSPVTGDASTRREIEGLRRRLPPLVQFLVGGSGAPPGLGPGVDVIDELSVLHDRARHMMVQAARGSDR